MNVAVRLRESVFSATERRIADYMLCHIDELDSMTISEIAESCDTSKSMIVQLCKTIGYKGYKDLRSQLQVEKALSVRRQEPDVFDSIYPGCTVEQICQFTIREEQRALQNTAELIDYAVLDKAVDWFIHADVVQLYGVGASSVAACDMYSKLRRVGLNARYVQDTHCQLLESTSLTPFSVALVFSYSGRTKDMLDACELCRASGARVVSITRFGKSPISDLSDIALYVASDESLRRVTSMSSRLSTLALVDILFACLASRMSEQIRAIVKRNTEIAEGRRK